MIEFELPLPGRSELRRRYYASADTYGRALLQVQKRLRSWLGDGPTLKYRVKSFESVYQKLRRRIADGEVQRDSVSITDLLGIRVVCPFLEDIQEAERILSERAQVVEKERKGARYSFQEFGYDSVHYLIRIPEEVRRPLNLPESSLVEVQLRTILQDAWAEVEHELIYKTDFTPFDEPLRRKLAALNANLSLADMVFQEIRDYQKQLRKQLAKRRESFWRTLEEANASDDAAALTALTDDSEAGFTGRMSRKGAFWSDDVPSEIAGSLIPGGDNVDNLLLRALSAHNEERLDDAVALYDRILEQEARSEIRTIILVHRGMARFVQRRYGDAQADFSLALKLDGTNAKALYYRALTKQVAGELHGAVDDFGACLKQDPLQIEPLLRRAEVMLDLGRWKDADADCRAALEIDPDSPEAQRLLRRVDPGGACGREGVSEEHGGGGHGG